MHVDTVAFTRAVCNYEAQCTYKSFIGRVSNDHMLRYKHSITHFFTNTFIFVGFTKKGSELWLAFWEFEKEFDVPLLPTMDPSGEKIGKEVRNLIQEFPIQLSFKVDSTQWVYLVER